MLVESVLCHKHLMLCGGSALSEEFYIGCECQKARSRVIKNKSDFGLVDPGMF